MTIVDRVGQALVAPRRALARTDAEGGGASDALALLLVKLVCLDLPALVMAGWAMLLGGFGQGLTLVGLRMRAALSMDVVLMFIGGIVVTLAAGRRRKPARDFDLACVAWIPVLLVDAAASLAANVLGATVPAWMRYGLWGAALLWMGGLLGAAVATARARDCRAQAGGRDEARGRR